MSHKFRLTAGQAKAEAKGETGAKGEAKPEAKGEAKPEAAKDGMSEAERFAMENNAQGRYESIDEAMPNYEYLIYLASLFSLVKGGISLYKWLTGKQKREFKELRNVMEKNPTVRVAVFNSILSKPDGMCNLLSVATKEQILDMVRESGAMSDREFLRHIAACAESKGSRQGTRSPVRAQSARKSPVRFALKSPVRAQSARKSPVRFALKSPVRAQSARKSPVRFALKSPVRAQSARKSPVKAVAARKSVAKTVAARGSLVRKSIAKAGHTKSLAHVKVTRVKARHLSTRSKI
jgi:hypothetical protein